MELIAKDGHHITQANLENEAERNFWSKLTLAHSLAAEDFTEWTDEQKHAWEAEEHPTAEDIPAEEALDIITGRADA